MKTLMNVRKVASVFPTFYHSASGPVIQFEGLRMQCCSDPIVPGIFQAIPVVSGAFKAVPDAAWKARPCSGAED